jgi:S1-C subfamily serine protease
VNRLWAIIIWLGAATAAWGWPAPTDESAQRPHPAVVRIIVPNRDGTSLGSGSLVAVTPTHGLVVTNWHVVREASGTITVAFPDGFRSAATVLRIVRDWDLAALAIWKPGVQPIPLATAAPQLGETLTIAGYGKGDYRASSGRCTQYVSPGGRLPYEIVELGTSAREGDSGGPILNGRGELSGVLFGTSVGLFGRTMGSYCGRVRYFLAPSATELNRMPGPETLIAQQPRVSPTPPASLAAASAGTPARTVATPPGPGIAGTPPRSGPAASQNPGAANIASRPNPLAQPPVASVAAVSRTADATPPASTPAAIGTSVPEAVTTVGLFDQIKSVLAVIGVALLFFNGLRLFGAAAH